MCAGALFWSQLGMLVYGASDTKRGYSGISKNLLHPKTKIIHGVLNQESEELMKSFFKMKR
jgi:tRNA(adenine34) deaminase